MNPVRSPAQKNLFKFGYSYDMTVSTLSIKTAGAHEISLQYQFGCGVSSVKKFNTVQCPSF